MFVLTLSEAVMLGLGWLAIVTILLLGVLVLLPRSRRLVPAYVRCPVLGQAVAAQVMRDEWTRRFCQVTRCDALGGIAPVTCNQKCLRIARGVIPLAAP